MFLLDTSASIGETDIAKSVQFVQEIIVELDVGQNQIHTALVTYGAHPEVCSLVLKENKLRTVVVAFICGACTYVCLLFV